MQDLQQEMLLPSVRVAGYARSGSKVLLVVGVGLSAPALQPLWDQARQIVCHPLLLLVVPAFVILFGGHCKSTEGVSKGEHI